MDAPAEWPRADSKHSCSAKIYKGTIDDRSDRIELIVQVSGEKIYTKRERERYERNKRGGGDESRHVPTRRSKKGPGVIGRDGYGKKII